jgi:hypothetical protein
MSIMPEEQAERLVNHATAIPHGESGDGIQLALFHQLHCLVGISRVIYPRVRFEQAAD